MSPLSLSEVLAEEWRPALGCTEPACVAYAASLAASLVSGPVRQVSVTCDPRMYKNCYAVGIPNSGHKSGLLWAAALGAFLPDPSAELELLRRVTADTVTCAAALLTEGRVHVEVDASRHGLYVECIVQGSRGRGRAVLEDEHTHVALLERNGVAVAEDPCRQSRSGSVREELAKSSFADLVAMARNATATDRELLRDGARMNVAIARHGFAMLPDRFIGAATDSAIGLAGQMVCAGVYARMWGADLSVMSLAGSGNKGITVAVPIYVVGEDLGLEPRRVEEALALACLLTSVTTAHLGSLSAACGCAHAAGVGLAGGFVHLRGGGPAEVSMAVTNMVGNVTGIICDGAKIGCALKTMSAVDAAHRAATLACEGIVIPPTDGIVGNDGLASLHNLARVATRGMAAIDNEVLDILRSKMGLAIEPS